MFKSSTFNEGTGSSGIWFLKKLCNHYQIRAQTRTWILQTHFEFAYFSCCYSYGIETINTLIHERSRSFLENHTRFQNKMSKVFLDQKSPNILPFGVARTYIYSLSEGVSLLFLTPFMIENMGVENSIFVRLMIQRTGMHTFTKNF